MPSPIAPDETLFRAIDALGPVHHLVSPNKLHGAHIGAWKQRYPGALAWASPGARERAASQGIAVAFDAELGDVPPPDWAESLISCASAAVACWRRPCSCTATAAR